MHIYIKNDGLYCKKFKGSDERFLSGLTDAIHSEAALTIAAWNEEFEGEELNREETDWLEESFEVTSPDDDEMDQEALDQGVAFDLFLKIFSRSVLVIDKRSAA